jgi:hypothetical protein
VNALAEFEARGIDFISLRDNLDLSSGRWTGSPNGKCRTGGLPATVP